MSNGYLQVSEEQYFNDPLPRPSLNSSIANLLLFKSPYHAWWNHPKLNPDCPPHDPNQAMSIGSAAHKFLLGKGQDLAIIHADDYRTKAAREARDEAISKNLIPLLPEQYDKAKAMAAKAQSAIYRDIGAEEWEAGRSEAVIAWEEEGGVLCRGRLDRVFGRHNSIFDYKTTGMSAEPFAASAMMYRSGCHFQMGFYDRGLNIIDPANIGRRRYLFLFQEMDPPYACSLIEPSEGGMTIARKQVMAAIGLWRHCLQNNSWPSYPAGVITAQLPPYLERQWIERELIDDNLSGETGMPALESSAHVYGAS